MSLDYHTASKNFDDLPRSPRGPVDRSHSLLTSNYHKQQQQLLEAAKKGEKEIVEMLLKQRVHVNCRDSLGYSPLMWAIYYGTIFQRKLIFIDHYDVCETLVDGIAHVNCRSKGGATPLHIAARFLEKFLKK